MSQERHIEHLSFDPPLGLSSPHAQTIIACFTPAGVPPPSTSLLIPLGDGDTLCCETSTPENWKGTEKTIVLVHGLGGSHISPYMVRLARKFYSTGYRVIRVNLRGCGSGETYANRPYHGGISEDIYTVLQMLKQKNPLSPIILIGFSLGGNIALKLAGDLGEEASSLIHTTISVCPPVDLAQTAALISRPLNRIYSRYYLRHLEKQTNRWTNGKVFSNIIEFDDFVTAHQWGFEGAFDYYHQCSSRFVLSRIKHPCHILFAADDPFIDYRSSLASPLSSSVKVWVAKQGGHMGFLGWSGSEHYYFWLDNQLLSWIKNL